ncbi:hypothetical protein C8J56DRAFT_900745 [Mycena floridula]|nr:hypothetical protein C8J56DRAFT_900745 [Mycena floridula]
MVSGIYGLSGFRVQLYLADWVSYLPLGGLYPTGGNCRVPTMAIDVDCEAIQALEEAMFTIPPMLGKLVVNGDLMQDPIRKAGMMWAFQPARVMTMHIYWKNVGPDYKTPVGLPVGKQDSAFFNFTPGQQAECMEIEADLTQTSRRHHADSSKSHADPSNTSQTPGKSEANLKQVIWNIYNIDLHPQQPEDSLNREEADDDYAEHLLGWVAEYWVYRES